MVETRKLVDPFNQAFMQIAKLSPDPELQKPKTAVALEPVQREFKTDYALPDEIVQILTNAFQQLGLELELMETDDTSVGEKFQHHKVKTATGEVVLIYCEERFVQVSDSFLRCSLIH